MRYRGLNNFERRYGKLIDEILRAEEIPVGFEFYCSAGALTETLMRCLHSDPSKERAKSMTGKYLTQKALDPLMARFGFDSLLSSDRVDQLAYSVSSKFWANDSGFYTLVSRLEWALIRGEIEY